VASSPLYASSTLRSSSLRIRRVSEVERTPEGEKTKVRKPVQADGRPVGWQARRRCGGNHSRAQAAAHKVTARKKSLPERSHRSKNGEQHPPGEDRAAAILRDIYPERHSPWWAFSTGFGWTTGIWLLLVLRAGRNFRVGTPALKRPPVKLSLQGTSLQKGLPFRTVVISSRGTLGRRLRDVQAP